MAREWSGVFETKTAAELALDSLARLDGYAGASVTALPGGGWRIVAHFAPAPATEAGAGAGGGGVFLRARCLRVRWQVWVGRAGLYRVTGTGCPNPSLPATQVPSSLEGSTCPTARSPSVR